LHDPAAVKGTVGLGILCLAAAAAPARAGRPPTTAPIPALRAHLAERLCVESAAPAVRRIVERSLPAAGTATLYHRGIGIYHQYHYQFADAHGEVGWQATLRMRQLAEHALRRDPTGRRSFGFSRRAGGTLAITLRAAGRRALILNEQTVTEYFDGPNGWRVPETTRFAERARLRQLSPGVFEVRYRAQVSAPTFWTRRSRFQPGTYGQTLTVKLAQPLAELWRGEESEARLRQLVFEAARRQVFGQA
jgi:hypothetical protein